MTQNKDMFLMEMDCGDIDSQLLPPNAFSDALLAPFSRIAPPQGNPFITKVTSIEKMLKKMPSIYQ